MSNVYIYLFRYNKSRIPGLSLLRSIKNWVWPSDSVLGSTSRLSPRDLSRIQRTPDGKFVLNGESEMEECELDISSSDDGGFLPRQRSPSVHVMQPPAWTSPWYFSDISSVRPDASAQLRTVHARYSQELPSLRAMHQQALLLRPGFVPVHPLATSSPPRGVTNNTMPRPKRSTMPLHIDPDSRSSSSGFGSKNTSGTSHHLLHPLPPYRPPPPAPLPPPPPNFIAPWLELAASRLGMDHTGVKADSVDGHYEFDRATPATSTPTGEPIPARKLRLTVSTASMRCDEIEARVQAMLQEFQAFRRRQAMRRAAALETVC